MSPLRRATAGLGAAIVLALGLPAAAPGVESGGADDIARYLADHRARTHVPGLAWAVVDRHGTTIRGTLGIDGDGERVTPGTPFFLGSVSKTLTAALVLRLADDGVLDLDAPVTQTLPWLDAAAPDVGRQITAARLLGHRSGFDADAGLRVADRRSAARKAVTATARGLRDNGPVAAPGTYQYSSANYLLLGALVEQATGRPFVDVLAEDLLHPLGLSGVARYAHDSGAVPPGHRLAWGRAWPYDVGPVAGGLPYGYAAATLNDAATLASSLLVARPGGVWPPSMLAAVRDGPAPDVEQARYDTGWRVERRDGERVAWHSGATPGFFSTVLLLPRRGLAVVLLQNGYAPARDAQLNEAAFDVARLATGRAVHPIDPDPLLLTAPWALVALGALLLTTTLVGARRRTVRPRRGRLWLLGGWTALLAAVAATAAWALSRAAAGSVTVLARWTPDLFLAGVALVGCCALAILVAAAAALRTARLHRSVRP
ncbi:D-alanyl-D-alanine carboxypeptidase [Mumia flava]|uniref:D-alanyl-D-alanine carboxypeptidase n=1 Tax=Mumia flava TaxID=1348852 RepID=A0A0B2B7E7_9ACTN|nr:serine hydrolase domain-containing protein [Mumia flava]PJJ57727.1 D-alanyl-D-alanine carboxypeptidase [Mumia flava]